jgi:hypothetical protein
MGPRHDQVTRAGIYIREHVTRAVEREQLTYAELMHILSQTITQWSTSEIREERDTDKS